jgi:hypothetical protein
MNRLDPVLIEVVERAYRLGWNDRENVLSPTPELREELAKERVDVVLAIMAREEAATAAINTSDSHGLAERHELVRQIRDTFDPGRTNDELALFLFCLFDGIDLDGAQH